MDVKESNELICICSLESMNIWTDIVLILCEALIQDLSAWQIVALFCRRLFQVELNMDVKESNELIWMFSSLFVRFLQF